jgi:hypothetical protein
MEEGSPTSSRSRGVSRDDRETIAEKGGSAYIKAYIAPMQQPGEESDTGHFKRKQVSIAAERDHRSTQE